MNIQSISIVVPTKGCLNNCKFCVSRMHESPYEDKFDEIAYRKRIKYAKMNNVNTLILTGTGEALQNTKFLSKLKDVLNKEHHPFPNVELQTTGVMLMDLEKSIPGSTIRTKDRYPKIELLRELGVNTISLSVSDIFDCDQNNWDIIGSPKKYRPPLPELCDFIKEQGFNLRLSLNMTNVYDGKKPEDILEVCNFLGADQITFRKLYHSDDDSSQTNWVKKNACNDNVISNLHFYIGGETRPTGKTTFTGHPHGKPLYRLPFGAMVYSYNGMSIAIDDNCMSKESYDQLKYVILRENGKLYCQWDDEGSLIF